MKPSLKQIPEEELRGWLASRGEPAFRLRQVRDWLFRSWCTDVSEMRNLPGAVRRDLDACFSVFSLRCTDVVRAEDDTEKFLFELADGESVETVLIPTPKRTTVCVSTQVGCPVRCSFCVSGNDGLVRNLTASEIVDQVVYVCRRLSRRVDNVVVMGMGEPLLNYANLVSALGTISDPELLGIGARHVTVSTSGIVPGIRHLADLQRQWGLAVSLHAPTDDARSRLIPSACRYPLDQILEACRYHRERTGRMCTLEYALVHGRNDRDSDARELRRIALDLRAKVNLIPLNPGAGPFCGSPPAVVAAFAAVLRAGGVRATVRRSRGEDIRAACGQLRRPASPPGAPPTESAAADQADPAGETPRTA